MPQVQQVIAEANPQLHARFARFRAAGAGWTGATAMVCEAEGAVQSAALLLERHIQTPAGPRPIAGIGAVATRPGSEGHGFASRLIAGCEQELARRGFSSAILFCSIVPFYQRLGWSVVPLSPPELPSPLADEGLAFRTVPLAAIPQEIRALYESAGTGAVIRSAALWRDYDVWPREDEDLFRAAYRNGQLAGYVRARRRDGTVELLEATGEALPALLADLIRRTGCSAIQFAPAVMMTRALHGAATAETNPTPWQPRTWWPIDRF